MQSWELLTNVGIDRRERIIEQINVAVIVQRSRQVHSSTLTAGQRASVTDDRLVALNSVDLTG